MARTFIVEGESFALVANLVKCAIHTDPARWISRPEASGRSGGSGPLREVSPGGFRPQRHRPKRMLDIAENQLLVLLLVMKAHFDEAGGSLDELIEVLLHRVIHPSS